MLPSLTIKGIIRYLKSLNPIYLRKVRETLYGFYLFELICDDGRINLLLCVEKGLILLSRLKLESRKTEGFILDLKRRIEDSRILNVRQVDEERILEFKLRKRGKVLLLYVELFGGGNIILTNGEKILSLKRRLKVKDRELKIGGRYILPPPRGSSLSQVSLELFKVYENKEVASFLINYFSIDKWTIKEALSRCNIEERTKIGELSLERIKNLIKVIKEVVLETEINPTPSIVHIDSKPATLLMFKPTFTSNYKLFKDLVNSCDEFLIEFLKEEEKRQVKEILKERSKIERTIDLLKKRLNELRRKQLELKEKAEYLSINHENLQLLINAVRSSESKVGMRIGNFVIKSIDRKKELVTVSCEKFDFSFELTEKKAFNIINRFYERRKRMLRGLTELEKRINEFTEKLRQIPSVKEAKLKVYKIKRKEWFEKYRWFISSDGILVIGGRDAKSNEEVVRKHAKPDSIVLHANIHGSPFTLIVTDQAEVPEKTLLEAAIFTASYSNAWKLGLKAIEVYWVRGKQLSKKPPSGQYLKKGAFMIYGKKNYLGNVSIELSVGLKITKTGFKLMVGPYSAILKHCEKMVRIKPGKEGGRKAAEKIVSKIADGVDELERETLINDLLSLLPPGGIEIENN